MIDFTGWKYTNEKNRVISSPDGRESKSISAKDVAEWITNGGVPVAADPPPGPPTNDEIYDQVMQQQAVLKAFALCINDGSIVPGANVSGAALKAAVKAKM